MEKLKLLEGESIKMIKSIPQICRKPAQFWSTGKDSTLALYLVKKAFGYFPWPIIHVDTGRKFREIYDFRDRWELEWGIPLLILKNDSALQLNVGPETVGRLECCTQLKTNMIKEAVKKYGFDAFIVSIRHDEHYVRGLEDLVSKRNEDGSWPWYSTAKYGGYGLTAPEHEAGSLAHLRVHPLLPWTEKEVWEFTMLNNLPINPLYFAEMNSEGRMARYRSLGCMPCTQPVESKAVTIQEIVNELYMSPGLERAGRMQDKETEDAMRILRGFGYF